MKNTLNLILNEDEEELKQEERASTRYSSNQSTDNISHGKGEEEFFNENQAIEQFCNAQYNLKQSYPEGNKFDQVENLSQGNDDYFFKSESDYD